MQAEVIRIHGSGMRGHPSEAPHEEEWAFDDASPCAMSLGAASPAFAYTAYVTNERDNTVSVVDLDKMETVKTIPVGQRPRGIVISPDGKFLYICAGDDDIVQIIDTKTQAGDRRPALGPRSGTPGARTRRGAALPLERERCARHHHRCEGAQGARAKSRSGVEPEGMGVSPDGKIVVNTSETTNMAHFIDTDKREVVANVLVDARPRYAEWKSDGSEVWVSAEVGGTVSVIDPVKHVVTGKITFSVPGLRSEAIQPVGIRFTKDGKLGFVALGPANRVAVVNAVTHQVEKYLLVGQRVWQLAFTPDQKYLISTNGVSNDISIIDVANLKVIKSVQVGSFPWGVAISPE